MREEHRRRAAEWFLTLHERPLHQATQTATPVTRKQRAIIDDAPDAPALYDTGLDAGEGLWNRTGWVGRG
ncbi:hypothetical protein G7066_04385 [Leucobacter coleopterorum]|uniref:Transposase n=1 Tax=Leucobacter coleopterorum TaxID=2714933 RepID=A0ABX6JWW7_9MICO|nr:hypothetical protein [Leucobacter coleopterorum]QIM18083.1 hypothetical protein G7066_04385 [Leucobacter coleopterorum]